MGLDPLQRLLSQVRQHRGRTLVDEELDWHDADDLREENEDLLVLTGSTPITSVRRLSFFSIPITDSDGLARATDQDFLGYVILKKDVDAAVDRTTRVYESVLRTSNRENNYVRGAPTYSCIVGGTAFRIQGYVYAQQNGLTNCCAHVALRTALSRFNSDDDFRYRSINDFLRIARSQRLGVRGLTVSEMKDVLCAAGATCHVGNYTTYDENAVPLDKYLYGSIESGYPAIVVFSVVGTPQVCHAIPIFGHTFNQDTWVPSAEQSYFQVGGRIRYIPSDRWLSTYIAHDDNFGSNFCIPKQFLYTRKPCDRLGQEPGLCGMESDCVAYVIGTMPREVKMDPIQAEVIGADYFFAALEESGPGVYDCQWSQRLKSYARNGRVVNRPILVSRQQYIDHLKALIDWNWDPVLPPEGLDEIALNVPDEYLWMVEFSIPQLFSANKRKLCEVLLRAQIEPTSQRDYSSFVLARIPGAFVVATGGDGEASRPGSFGFYPTVARGHVQLYGAEYEDTAAGAL